jgi:hypothetical protein
MSDSAKVRIERLQPYHRHGLRKQNVLWILNDLSSTDQHTALAPESTRIRSNEIARSEPARRCRMVRLPTVTAHDRSPAAAALRRRMAIARTAKAPLICRS